MNQQALAGRFGQWMRVNLDGLLRVRNSLHRPVRRCLNVAKCPIEVLLPRVWGVITSSVRRQNALDNLGLFVAAALGKI